MALLGFLKEESNKRRKRKQIIILLYVYDKYNTFSPPFKNSNILYWKPTKKRRTV